jgi:tetratricopeptide (TPR) repeat protein
MRTPFSRAIQWVLHRGFATQGAKPKRILYGNNSRILNDIAKTKPDLRRFKDSIMSVSRMKPDSVTTMNCLIEKFNSEGLQFDTELFEFLVRFYAEHEVINPTEIRKTLEKLFHHNSSNEESASILKFFEKGNILVHNNAITKSTALQFVEIARSSGIEVSHSTLLRVLASCASLGLGVDAQRCLEICKEQGCKITESMIGHVIVANGKAGDAFAAQTAFEQLLEQGLVPDVSMYTRFAKALVQAKQVPAALDVLTRLVPAANLKVSAASFNQLLFELIVTEQLEDAEELFEMMSDNIVCQPDYSSKALGITIYSLLNKFDKAVQLYRSDVKYPLFSEVPFRLGFFGRLCLSNSRSDLAKEIYTKYCRNDIGLCLALIKTGNMDVEELKQLGEHYAIPKTLQKETIRFLYTEYLASCTNLQQALEILTTSKDLIGLDSSLLRQLWLLYERSKGKAQVPKKLGAIDFEYLIAAAATETPGDQYGRGRRVTEITKLMKTQEFQPNVAFYDKMMNYMKSRDGFVAHLFQDEMIRYSFIGADSIPPDNDMDTSLVLKLVMKNAEDANWENAMKYYDVLVARKFRFKETSFRHLMQFAARTKKPQFLSHIFKAQIELLSEDTEESKRLREYYFEVAISMFSRIPSAHELVRTGLAFLEEFGKPFQSFEKVVQFLYSSKFKQHHSLADQLVATRKRIEPNYDLPRHLKTRELAVIDFERSSEQALSFYQKSKELSIPIKEEAFPHIIEAFIEMEEKEKTLDVFDEYLDSTDTPSVDIFNQVLQFLVEKQDIPAALRIKKVMESMNVIANDGTMSILLYGYAIVENDIPAAMKIFEMIEKNQNVLQQHCLIMISGLAKAKDIEGILLLLTRNRNLTDPSIYETALNSACETNRLDIGFEILEMATLANGIFQ